MRPIGHRVPVGVQSARGLAATFNDVTHQASCSQQIQRVAAPAELVHQDPQCHGGIHTAPGDDHLRPGVQGRLDRQRAQIGVGRQDLRRQWRAALHFTHRRGRRAQLINQWHDVVARDHGNVERHALLHGQCRQRRSAGVRVDAARVADDPNAVCHHVLQHRFHGHRDEIRGVTQLGLFLARAGQNGHGQLGQIVKHQVVNLSAGDQLRRADAAVAPKPASAANSYPSFARCHTCLCSFFTSIGTTIAVVLSCVWIISSFLSQRRGRRRVKGRANRWLFLSCMGTCNGSNRPLKISQNRTPWSPSNLPPACAASNPLTGRGPTTQRPGP